LPGFIPIAAIGLLRRGSALTADVRGFSGQKVGCNGVAECWHPQMVGCFSAAGFAALDELKTFINEKVDAAALDEAALFLAGQSAAVVHDRIAECGHEIAEGFAHAGMQSGQRNS
jgi:hypothetical protein